MLNKILEYGITKIKELDKIFAGKIIWLNKKITQFGKWYEKQDFQTQHFLAIMTAAIIVITAKICLVLIR